MCESVRKRGGRREKLSTLVDGSFAHRRHPDGSELNQILLILDYVLARAKTLFTPSIKFLLTHN